MTTKEKWKQVDQIIDDINYRKKHGYPPCLCYLDEYINYHFNKQTKPTKQDNNE